MAWDDSDVAVEFHQLAEDAGHQGVVVGPLVVCAAYAAGKECVSAEEDLLIFLEETYSSWCMSRGFYHFETEVSDLYDVSFLDVVELGSACRAEVGWNCKAECVTERRIGFLDDNLVSRMHVDRHSVELSGLCYPEDMVEMSVGEENRFDAQFPVLYKSVEFVAFLLIAESRINDCTVVFVVPYETAALLKEVECEIFCMYHPKNQLIIQKYKKSY